ncbi:MAG: alanine/glycine:cation symporter family protein [Phycisphaerales bacterium]|nr:alanine/glycine:cation symporter family protein [Phycisphaerales bacterium]
MDGFNDFLGEINDVIWTNWMLYILLGTGLLFTLWSGISQWRSLTHGVTVTAGKYDDPNDPGAISHFQALSAALSATVGLGNIAGVAIAIALGGPGAVFWMWVIGIIGMSLKTTEVCQSMLFRNTDDPDNPHGGPMFVVAKGFKKWGLGWIGMILGVLFCLTLLVSTITGGNMFQAWSVGDISHETLGVRNWIPGVILAVIVALVILGGIRRIGQVAGLLVPFMCLMYIITAIVVLAFEIDQIPDLIGLIFRSAFSPSEAGGAFLGGAAGFAFLWGMKRALFSSESGQGSSPIAHSAARTKEPVSESVVAGLEPFIDTIIVCTLTALVILSTGALTRGGDGEGLDGAWETPPKITITEIPTEETDKLTGEKKMVDKPHWVVGTPTTFRDGDETVVEGKSSLPKRSEEGQRIDRKEWRHGDVVFIIAQGDDTLNIDTNSNRAKFYGKVKIPEDANESRYIRWKSIAADDDNLTHFDHLVETEDITLTFPGLYKEYKGASLTAYAINRVLPGWGSWIILIAAWLFAISTMISWSYYGEQGIVFLFGKFSKAVIPFYKIIYCCLAIVATLPLVETTTEIGNLSDLGTGLMLWVNIPIMLIFGSVAMVAYHSYFKRLRSGEIKRTKKS